MKQIPLWGPEAPPKLQRLTRELRFLNTQFNRPIVVSLNAKGLIAAPNPDHLLQCICTECKPAYLGTLIAPVYGRELLPGRSQKFDAVASARRLLAALRDLEPSGAR